VAVGFTNSESSTFNFYVQKFSSSCSIEFIRKFGTLNHDYLAAARRLRDGGYILAGISSKNALDENLNPDPVLDFNSKLYVVKLDSNFNLEWEKIIGGSFGSQGLDVNEDASGILSILGKQTSHGNDVLEQYFIIRLKPDGSNEF
jgi:hypothetical protein